jgi:hypothetical protein
MEFMAVTSCSGICVRFVVGDDHDWAVGVVRDLGADRAKQQPRGGQAGDGPDGDRQRPRPFVGLFKNAVRLLLSHCECLLGQAQVSRRGDRGGPEAGACRVAALIDGSLQGVA